MGSKIPSPGTELRRVNDSLYKLYECSSVYDKEKKRARKITGKYLGSITEAGGFKESRKRIMEREIAELKEGKSAVIAEPKIGEVKEFGLSDYILTEQSDCIYRLKQVFHEDWSRIIALVYCRLRFQSPMRRVAGDFAIVICRTRLAIGACRPMRYRDFFMIWAQSDKNN